MTAPLSNSFQSPSPEPLQESLPETFAGSEPEPMIAPSPGPAPLPGWLAQWQRVARRIRVPLGFVAAAIYLSQLWERRPEARILIWSLPLLLAGLWLRGYASGYVKKNRELTVTGPYAYTRNPLYLGSMLIAAGFALALGSWPFTAILIIGFVLIYVPVIASEEAFLRSAFPEFEAYCRRVPRLIPRRIPGVVAEDSANGKAGAAAGERLDPADGKFSPALYLKHREYNSALGGGLLYISLWLTNWLHRGIGR